MDKSIAKYRKECKANHKESLSLTRDIVFNAFYEIILANFSGINKKNLSTALDKSFSIIEKRIEGLSMLYSSPSGLSYDKIIKKIRATDPDNKRLKLDCLLLTMDIGSTEIFTNNYDSLNGIISKLLKKMIGDNIKLTKANAKFNALAITQGGECIEVDFRLSAPELERCLYNKRDYYYSIAAAITGYLLWVCAAQSEAQLDKSLDDLLSTGKYMDVFDKNNTFIKSANPLLFNIK